MIWLASCWVCPPTVCAHFLLRHNDGRTTLNAMPGLGAAFIEQGGIDYGSLTSGVSHFLWTLDPKLVTCYV